MQISIGLFLSPALHAPVGASLSLAALGPLVAGTVMQASVAGADPATIASLSYRWLRDGAPIAGATGPDYTLTDADLGTALSVEAVRPDSTVLASSRSVQVPDVALTANPFSRDGVVFDSGAAFGRSAASVPLSGRAGTGAAIEARAVSIDDGGAAATAWQAVGSADAAGDWAGTLSVPRAPAWFRVEIRDAAAPAQVTALPQRVAAGHVIDLWGQSELHRAVLSTHPGVSPPPAIADPEALQVSYSDAAGTDYGTALAHTFVDGADARLAGKLGALANVLAAERPGEKFHVVFHTLSASGVVNLLDDEQTGRDWADDATISAHALADGQAPGLAIQSWYAADSSVLTADYGDAWIVAISGLNPDGSAHVRGTALPGQASSTIDHYFSDLYDYTRTRWAIAGPHRFAFDQYDTNIGIIRDALDVAFANPVMTDRAVRVLEPLSYQNDAGDPLHPDPDNPDGTSRLMVQMGHAMLEGLGLGYTTPVLDQWSYDGAGTLTIGSSAGPVTTTRLARGNPLPAGRPAVDQVFVNNFLTANVSVAGGEIVVTGLSDGDTVTVGAGGIGTGEIAAEDLTALTDETWQDWPIVDLGQAGMEGLPVRGGAKVPPGVIPEAAIPPDPNPNPSLVSADTTGMVFTGDPGIDGWYEGDTGWTFNGDGTASSIAGQTQVFMRSRDNKGTDLHGLDMELSFVLTTPDGGTGDLRIQVRAAGGGGTNLFGPQDITPTYGARNTITLATHPAQHNLLDIYIMRQSGATGTATLSEITVKER